MYAESPARYIVLLLLLLSCLFFQEHPIYSFTIPKCLHLAATCDLVKSWSDDVCKRAEMFGLVATISQTTACLVCPVL